jgi:hypothetical protein
MDGFSIFNVTVYFVFFGGAIVLFFVLTSIYYLAKTRVAYVKTPANNLEKILAEIKLPAGSLIYDLGCGDGSILFLAEKLGYTAVGYELSLYPYLKCLIRKAINRSQVKFYRKNFWQMDLSEANIIFIFLVKSVMAKTGEKLQRELKPGTLVASYGFELPSWKIFKVISTSPSKTYIYKI